MSALSPFYSGRRAHERLRFTTVLLVTTSDSSFSDFDKPCLIQRFLNAIHTVHDNFALKVISASNCTKDAQASRFTAGTIGMKTTRLRKLRRRIGKVIYGNAFVSTKNRQCAQRETHLILRRLPMMLLHRKQACNQRSVLKHVDLSTYRASSPSNWDWKT